MRSRLRDLRLWLSGRAISRNRRGVAALEFAVVAPMFLVLVYGGIVYGIFFATWVMVSEAASEGARASLAGMSSSERQSLASSAVNRIFASYEPLLSAQNMSLSFPATPNPNLFAVAIGYDFSHSPFATFATIVPLPATNPSATVTVSNGGY